MANTGSAVPRAKLEEKRRKEEEKRLREEEKVAGRSRQEGGPVGHVRLASCSRLLSASARRDSPGPRLGDPGQLPELSALLLYPQRIKAEKAEITRFFQKPKTPQAPKVSRAPSGRPPPFLCREAVGSPSASIA